LTLPAAPSNQPWSETFFSTQAIGTVVLTYGGRRIASIATSSSSARRRRFPCPDRGGSPRGELAHQRDAAVFRTGDRSNDTAVLWSVQEVCLRRIRRCKRLYTAPATAGTFHVVATQPCRSHALRDRDRDGAPPLVNVTMRPQAAKVVAGGTQQFTAQVSGTADTALLWSIWEAIPEARSTLPVSILAACGGRRVPPGSDEAHADPSPGLFSVERDRDGRSFRSRQRTVSGRSVG